MLQIRLQKGPSGTDQNDQREKRDSFQETEHVKQDVPAVGAAGAFDVRFIFGLAQQIQRFEGHDSKHEKVDAENSESFLVKDVDPETGEGEVD